jgi:hypothetical protein
MLCTRYCNFLLVEAAGNGFLDTIFVQTGTPSSRQPCYHCAFKKSLRVDNNVVLSMAQIR